ncbi:MAG: tRNA-intron lyase [Candidatus Woesearchaeota archaeon]
MSTKKFKAAFSREVVISEGKEARSVYDKSRFGEIKDKKILYTLVEALYLIETKKMNVYDSNNKIIKEEAFIKKARDLEPNFTVRYAVFKELRSRGYVVKTALKFGADFRVYDRGVKPGEDHAKWIVFPVFETDVLTWFDFAAKNRVAHSTRKKLLLAVVDSEKDVSFWESGWIKP